MSSYLKLIIFIVILLGLSAAVVFVDSSIDNINDSMPAISNSIVQGDKDYNESVELLNNRNFEESSQKAQSAGDNYNNSLNKLRDIQNKFDKDLNNVHKQYISVTIQELQLKLNAVEELEESIYYLRNYYNSTGSSHGSEANDYMYDALNYQNQRNEIVKNNSKLFIEIEVLN